MSRWLAPTVVVCFAATAMPAHARQSTDPKAEFVQALGRLSLDLNGASGDEGSRILPDIARLERALAQWDAIIASYETAMAADLRTADRSLAARMHTAIGAVYLDRGRVDAALREFATASELDPMRPDVALLRAFAYSQATSDVEQATQAFGRAVALAPADPIRLYALARHLMKAGRADEAAKALRAFIDMQKPHAASTTRTPQPAPFIHIELVPEAAGVEPYFPLALYADGFARLHRRDLAGAIAAFKEAASRDPLVTGRGTENERLRLARADTLIDTEQYAAADRLLRELIEQMPSSGRAYYALARLRQRQGLYPEAVSEFERSLTFSPLLGANGIYKTMGMLMTSQQDFAGAASAFEKRVDVHPNDPDAHHDLGLAYFRQGRDDDALAEFAVTLIIAPARADTFAAISQLHVRKGNYEEAAQSAQTAVMLDPKQMEARYVLGTALLRLGRSEAGRRELEIFRRLQDEAAAAHRRQLESEALQREAIRGGGAGR